MSFLKRLNDIFSPAKRDDLGKRSYMFEVRCRRCGEIIPGRVDLLNELSQDYDTGLFTSRKVVMGSGKNRCFQQIEVIFTFNNKKQLIDQQVIGGEIVEPLEPDDAEA